MKKSYLITIFLAIITVLAVINQSQKPNTPSVPAPTTANPVMSVQAILPKADTLEQDINASGVIKGQDIAEVGAKISGIAIDKVLVDVGDTVKKGQVLATLDARKASADIINYEANIATATANLQKATNDLARVTPLVEIGAISRTQFDSYQTAKINAEANLKSAKAQAYQASVNTADTQIVAPLSGIISQKNAHIGMMTTGTALFTIIKNNALQWQALVSGDDIHKISIGQTAMIGSPDNQVYGVVQNIAPTANSTGEIMVFVSLDDPKHLRHGMYTQGKFITQDRQTFTLPTSVVTTTDGFDYVWVLLQHMPDKPALDNDLYYANRQKINITYRNDTKVATDLPKDTKVIYKSGNFLNDGDVVRLVGDLS